LQRTNVFVTHAGMNSVQESLYYSVPMVLIPQQMEQLINAKVVQQAGAGIVLGTALSFGKVSAQQLKEAVDEVLKNPAHCQAAQTISTALRTAGGYLKAADLIMEQAVK
jgi:UDP:flavonoid glycosyltransferase YjiC (YdhE family)